MLNSWRLLMMIAAWWAVTAEPAGGQVQIELGPMLGHYRPVGHFDEASVYSTSLPSKPAELAGTALGGEVRVWVNERFGLQIQAGVASSTIGPVMAPGGPRGPTPAQVLTVAVQGLYRPTLILGSISAWLGAGCGLVRHGGEAYERHGSPTDLAGVVGVGGTVPVIGRLRATAGLTGILYPFKVPMPPRLRGNPGPLQHGLRKDLLLHVGLNWRWH